MAAANTLDTLNGLFKKVYADKLEDIIPDGMKLMKMIPFSKSEGRIGDSYNQPCLV